MTKAYLAGFIAGTQGKTWDDNPYNESNGLEYSQCAMDWRIGLRDAERIGTGCNYTGREELE